MPSIRLKIVLSSAVTSTAFPLSSVEQAGSILFEVLVQVPLGGHAGVHDQDRRLFASASFDQAEPLAGVAVGPDHFGGVAETDAPLPLAPFDGPRPLGHAGVRVPESVGTEPLEFVLYRPGSRVSRCTPPGGSINRREPDELANEPPPAVTMKHTIEPTFDRHAHTV